MIGLGVVIGIPSGGSPEPTGADNGVARHADSVAGGSVWGGEANTNRLAGPGSEHHRDFVARRGALPVRRGDATRSANLRTRIVIPALAVSAPVVPISAPGGSLVPPSSPSVIGWWSGGARPSARTGTAVLTGHTVHTGGGAFDDLNLLAPGERVRIDRGHRADRYVVTSVRIYRKASLANHAASVFDQSVTGRLALVTCEDWNGGEYLSNVVVLAEPSH